MRTVMTVLALMAGTFSFAAAATLVLALPAMDAEGIDRLFEFNTTLGSAVLLAVFGTVLVYQAASAMGSSASRPMTRHVPWYLGLAFPVCMGTGQWLVLNPTDAPWLFPIVNIGIVAIPSLLIATVVMRRYGDLNTLSWPVTWREWTAAFCYGAIGAVTIAGLLNTGYLLGGGWLVLQMNDIDVGFDIQRGLPALPRNTAILFDLSVLSLVAPLNEEFLKGAIVALFFWRRGSVARCFAWGVLAGAGFNLVETFFNSLELVDSSVIGREGQAGQWWMFGVARAGAGAMHALAAGFAAVAFYGLLRKQWRFMVGYPIAVLLHANWNAAVYLMAGDSILSGAGPSSDALVLLGLGFLLALSTGSVALLWTISGRFRDQDRASIYEVLRMGPARAGAEHFGSPPWVRARMKPLHPG